MKFRFYYIKVDNYDRELKYFKDIEIIEDNLSKAKSEFMKFINSHHTKYSKIKVININKIIEENGQIRVFTQLEEKEKCKNDKINY